MHHKIPQFRRIYILTRIPTDFMRDCQELQKLPCTVARVILLKLPNQMPGEYWMLAIFMAATTLSAPSS